MPDYWTFSGSLNSCKHYYKNKPEISCLHFGLELAALSKYIFFFSSYNQRWWHLGIQTNYITNTTEVGRILSGLFARWLIDKQEGSTGDLFHFWLMCRQCFETGPEIVKNLTEYINENMIFKSDYRDWKLCGGESWVRAEGQTFTLPQIKAFTASDDEWDLAELA